MTEPPADAALDDLVARVADEFEARRARGEDPDPEEYAARHPEAADDIRGVLGLFGRAVAPTPAAAAGRPPAALGDYRIVRELGRGGMGVVYEAEQLSLRRRVALKVLPFAAVLDPRHLQRFKSEAMAAAGLDHPHVVKVYGVGQDRGVHYIAMQFVDGRTLADLIRERRGESPAAPAGAADPTRTYAPDLTAATPVAGARPAGSGNRTPADTAYARRVAGWGAQAAEALEHAHALGVVHRDVKPGNLLVDGRGTLYVADFGLARVATDPGVTGTGDLLGTPRYMSPEQAAAKHGLVDHRSDVYSLGATLYELLTLEPAVAGADRAAVLRRVADADPTPPRRVDPRVPRELETVVLKCLEKDPTRRYQSAGELAADLRRWLDHEPVRARRPGPGQRATKWAMRHRYLVRGAAAALTAAVVVGAVGSFLVWQKGRETAAAYRQVKDERDRAVKAEADAAAQRDAEARRRRQARDALDAMTGQWMEDVLSTQQKLLPEHEAFLKQALSRYEEFAADTGQDEAARAGVAAAHLRAGKIRADLGLRVEAEEAYVRARQLFTQLVAEFPSAPAYREGLAASHYGFGVLLSRSRARPGEAEEAFRAALDLRRLLAAQFPAVPAHRHELAFAHARLGSILEVMGRLGEAEAAHRAALDLRDRLAVDFPAVPLYQRVTAGARVDLAGVLHKMGRPKEAEEAIRTAMPVYRRVAEDYPTADNRDKLAWAYNRLGFLYDRTRRPAEAAEAYRSSLAIQERLLAEYPTVVRYRQGVALNHTNLGDIDLTERRYPEAEAAAREAIRLDPTSANAHGLLGDALLGQARYAEAAAAAREAVRLDPKLAPAHAVLGDALRRAGDVPSARVALTEAARLDKRYASRLALLPPVPVAPPPRPADR